MATSGTYVYNITAESMITEALRHCGVLEEGGSASTIQINDCLPAFEAMLKSFSNHGLQLWTIEQTTITLTLGTITYDVFSANKSLKITDIFYRDSDDNDTTLFPLTRQEYNELSDKDQQNSLPTQYYFDPRRDASTLYIWPTAESTIVGNQLHVTYQQRIEDVGLGTNNIDVPAEWFEAIIYNLATRRMHAYGVPATIRRELRQMASDSLGLALAFDTEQESIYFQPARNRGQR